MPELIDLRGKRTVLNLVKKKKNLDKSSDGRRAQGIF